MKYIKLLLLLFLPFLTNAQSTYEHFAAYGTTSGISLVSADTFNFTITGFAGNARPYGAASFARADVLVGDKIFLNCNQYVVRSITSTAPNLVGTLYKIDGSTNNPTNSQVVAIIREYTNAQGLISYALPPSADGNGGALSGINISSAACIQAHYSKKDSLTLSNAFNNATDVYVYVGTSGVLPSVSPPTITQHLARNTAKELYQYNGSAWVLVGSGGGTVDTAGYKVVTRTITDGLYDKITTKFDSSKFKVGGIQASALSQQAIDSIKALANANQTVSNGLTKTGTNTKLGGTLTNPTTITVDLSNPLQLAGLPTSSNANSTGTESNQDFILIKGGTGDTIKKIPSQYFIQLKDTSNFAVKNNISGQPTFTTIPPIKSVAGASNDSIAMINSSTGLVTLANKTTISDKQTVISTTAAFVAQTDNTKDAVYFTEANKTGWFYKVSSGTADSAVTFTDVSGQKWKREESNYFVRPEWWGAVIDDGTADNVAIQRAIDYAIANKITVVKFKAGQYDLSDGVTIYKKSGSEYSFVTLTLEGASKTFASSVIAGTKFSLNYVNGYGIGIQKGRNCEINNIEIQNSTQIAPNFRQTVEWADTSWSLSGTIRDNLYSPSCAIVIDPFHVSVTGGNQYPTKTSYYTNSSTGGTSHTHIDGCAFYYNLVTILIAPNGSTQNCDNITMENSTISNTKIAWATCQTQSRGNIISKNYFLGAVGVIMSASAYGQQNGTLPVFENNNVAGGTKWLLVESNVFDDIKVSNNYFEGLWAIGYAGAKTCNFSNNCFNFALSLSTTVGDTAALPPVIFDGKVVNFFGGSLSYFDNCTKIYNLRFISNIKTTFEGVSFESLLPFAYEGSGGYDKIIFRDCYNKCTGSIIGQGVSAVENIGNLTGFLMGKDTKIKTNGGQTFTSLEAFSHRQSYLGTCTITINYSNNTAKIISPNKGLASVGDMIERYILGSSYTYAGRTYTATHRNYGVVKSITQGTADTIITEAPSGGLSDETAAAIAVRPLQFMTPSFVTTTSGSNVLTNYNGKAPVFSLVGSLIKGSGIPTDSYIVSVSGTNITISNNATANANNVFIKTCDYKSEQTSTNGAKEGAFEPYAVLTNVGTDTTIEKWITFKGGVSGTSYPAVWTPIYKSAAASLKNETGNVGINMVSSTPSYKLDIDANTSSTGNPIRAQGLLQGTTTGTPDSIVSSASGVLKRVSIDSIYFRAIRNGTNYTTTIGTVRLPRLTTTQRDALNSGSGSFTGDVIYNSTTNTYQVADGASSNWIDLATGTTTYASASYDNSIAAGSRDSVVITVAGLTTSTGAASVYYVASVHESGIVISPAKVESGQIKIYLDNLNLLTAKAFSGILKVMVRRL